jgi:hypothetical protein
VDSWAQARPRASGSQLALHRRTRKYRRAARLGCNMGLSGSLEFDSSNHGLC